MAYFRTDGHRSLVHQSKSIAEFLQACRGTMRVRRMSLRTEDSYLYYIRCYLEFHRRRPEEMAQTEVEAFLTHLASEKRVAASTQNVAFAALIYLYREVLGIELENVAALRAKRARRAPDVLSRDEVWRLLRQNDKWRGIPSGTGSWLQCLIPSPMLWFLFGARALARQNTEVAS